MDFRNVADALGIKKSLKRSLREGLGRRLLCDARLRRQLTGNYTSGKLAIGEQNTYVPVFPVDWVKIDRYNSDFDLNLKARPRLPFEDGTQRVIYSAHTVEHLDDAGLQSLFSECARVLEPGGIMRLEAPDAELLVDAYRSRNDAVLSYFRERRREWLVERLGFDRCYLEDHLTVLGEISSYIDWPRESGHIPAYAPESEFRQHLERDTIDQLGRWCVSLQTEEQLDTGGHQNTIYMAKLERMLMDAGFSRVDRVEFGRTGSPLITLNDGWGSIREKDYRRFYSLYVEAYR